MRKLATPEELAHELQTLLRYAESSHPSREKIASKLMALADRVRTAQSDYRHMTLSEIAHEISDLWRNVYFGAKPYLQAMYSLNVMDPNDAMYGMDPGASIVAYFLANARGFKGPEAREIKKELKRRLR